MPFLDTGLRGKTTRSGTKPKSSSGSMYPVVKGTSPMKTGAAPRKPVAANSNSLVNVLGSQAQQNKIQKTPSPQVQAVTYESDPVLARIRALSTQNVGNAETEAAAIRKQAIVDTGLTDVGRELGLDEATLGAANTNPFSALAMLRRNSALAGRELDEGLNQQNLFWSGHRANQLGDLARNTAEMESGLNRDLRSILGQADQGVLDARARAAAEEQAAIEAAAEQARQDAFLRSLLAPEVVDEGITSPAETVWPGADTVDPVSYNPVVDADPWSYYSPPPQIEVMAPNPTVPEGWISGANAPLDVSFLDTLAPYNSVYGGGLIGTPPVSRPATQDVALQNLLSRGWY